MKRYRPYFYSCKQWHHSQRAIVNRLRNSSLIILEFLNKSYEAHAMTLTICHPLMTIVRPTVHDTTFDFHRCCDSRAYRSAWRILYQIYWVCADSDGRAVDGVCLRSLAFWGSVIESCRWHWCLSRVSGVGCQVDASAAGRSLVQRSPTDCLRLRRPMSEYGCSATGKNTHIYIYMYIYNVCGPGSPAGIATDFRLDGPESNPDRDEIFRPSRPVLWPIQPPVKWVPGLSRG